jgi:predicted RNA binding protein YcfA (HicA-like mRNA interferase family)
MTEQDIPAITGKQLIRLLEKDGWTIHHRANHGLSMKKKVNDRTLVTIVPIKKHPFQKVLYQISLDLNKQR